MTESNLIQAASHPESSQSQSQIQEPIEVENAEILEIIDAEGRIKRKRGIQHAKDVWNLQAGERIAIKCNRFGQPLKKGGGILSGWLGLVARMKNWCPIDYKRWKIVPSRYKIDPLNLTRDNVATKIVEKGGTSESSEATSYLQDEAYTDILGKDGYGRVRGYGIGVTPTQLFGVEAYIRKMGCGRVDSMEMQRFQDQMQSTLKAHEEQMQTMQINYESQIQTMQKNHEEQMEAMHNSCEAKLAEIQSQLDQVTFMLLRFFGSFNNPIAGLAHFGSNIHQVNPSSSNDERDML